MVVCSRRARWHNSSSKPRTPLTGQPVRGAFSCDCQGKRHQNSAPINRVPRFDGRHEQRPYSLGRIVMSLVHKRSFLLLNPKLTRHPGRALRPNRIEHANTLAGLGRHHIHKGIEERRCVKRVCPYIYSSTSIRPRSSFDEWTFSFA